MSFTNLLIDSHCHLDFRAFVDDRLELWSRCQSSGVRIAIIPGVMPYSSAVEHHNYVRSLYKPDYRGADPESGSLNKDKTKCVGAELIDSDLRDLGWYFTAGLHPWWIDRYLAGLDRSGPTAGIDHSRIGPELSHSTMLLDLEKNLYATLESDSYVGLGESGLDFNIKTPPALQIESLKVHLTLSAEKKLPVILHSVKAHSQLIATIKQFPGSHGVIHAFTGSYDIAAQYWQLGFALGVGGVITYGRAKKTRDAIKRMPMESLVLETDAPDMPLQGRQGQRNSPEYLPDVAKHLADLKGCSFEEVARQTTENTLKVFSLVAP